jgi:hypothetical protein
MRRSRFLSASSPVCLSCACLSRSIGWRICCTHARSLARSCVQIDVRDVDAMAACDQSNLVHRPCNRCCRAGRPCTRRTMRTRTSSCSSSLASAAHAPRSDATTTTAHRTVRTCGRPPAAPSMDLLQHRPNICFEVLLRRPPAADLVDEDRRPTTHGPLTDR